ncbi:hypothetical protein SNEBB_004885 [Seison nebaliae]|nr:hypothetical protein SNEBB_004885 [Seison nebaliae]
MSNRYRWIKAKRLFDEHLFPSKDHTDYNQWILKSYEDEFWKFTQMYYEKTKSMNNHDFQKKMMKSWESINFGIKFKNLNFLHQVDMRGRSKLEKFLLLIHLFLQFKMGQLRKQLKELRKNESELPIFEKRTELLELIRDNPIILIAGDTGCGKSTQIPRYLIDEGYKNIVCTQPRRIAAINLAKRVSYETLMEGSPYVDNFIGHQIRFDKNRSIGTKILFVTEGILLKQFSSDSQLSQYDVIIMDEIHERNIHTDLLIGIMKCLFASEVETKRKLILMSATINMEMFSQFFWNCPILQVSGRLFPIELEYRSPSITTTGKRLSLNRRNNSQFNVTQFSDILKEINGKFSSGDVLIFVNGIKEIRRLLKHLKEFALEHNNWIILPLHSTLDEFEQSKVFRRTKNRMRKCIVSTNIAETSVTIDNIRFVIDSGKVNEKLYESERRIEQLKEVWISKASADQRKGRCGRSGPGRCYRLYSEKDYDEFLHFSISEIRRCSLENIILQLVSMGLNKIDRFPWIESPKEIDLNRSLNYLKNEDALIDMNELITLSSLGELLTDLPIDLFYSKFLILLASFENHPHLIEIGLTLAAILGLSTQQNLFGEKSFIQIENSDDWLLCSEGDLFTILYCFHAWLSIKLLSTTDRWNKSNEHSNNNKLNYKEKYLLRKELNRQLEIHSTSDLSTEWCRKKQINQQKFYEIIELRSQLKRSLIRSNLYVDSLHSNHKRSIIPSNDDELSGNKRKHSEQNFMKKFIRSQKSLNERRERSKRLGIEENFDNDLDGVHEKNLLSLSDRSNGKKEKEENKFQMKNFQFELDIDNSLSDLRFYLKQLNENTNNFKYLKFADSNNNNSDDDERKNKLTTICPLLMEKDMFFLKYILTSTLKEQISIANPQNTYRRDQPQLYHRNEQSATVHPNSVYTFLTQCLAPPPNYEIQNSHLLSVNPNILVFGNILKTDTTQSSSYLISNTRFDIFIYLLIICPLQLYNENEKKLLFCDEEFRAIISNNFFISISSDQLGEINQYYDCIKISIEILILLKFHWIQTIHTAIQLKTISNMETDENDEISSIDHSTSKKRISAESEEREQKIFRLIFQLMDMSREMERNKQINIRKLKIKEMEWLQYQQQSATSINDNETIKKLFKEVHQSVKDFGVTFREFEEYRSINKFFEIVKFLSIPILK